ncbi:MULTISPECIES: hypothetical protein [Streptomyces]|uniref:hypothetical protein n=1 Tax=Streptomyces TaxID=1883 RepID=UPI000AB11605|nr:MULTISPECIES: hypothetical protein [Streptomyces]WTD02913.1 hypothetical protein OH717_10220 [Streptomyces albidoflavus]
MRYRSSPERDRDRDLDTVLLSGAILDGLLALNSDHLLYVLPPLCILMAPMVGAAPHSAGVPGQEPPIPHRYRTGLVGPLVLA